jgi:hypothetical protein
LNGNIDHFRYIKKFIEDLLEYNPEDTDIQWRLIPDHIGGTMEVVGPCGITLTFLEKICYFHHYIRWRNFLLDSEIQLKLREVCYELMQTMKSQFVIYVPDNAVKESAILDFLWEDENKDIFFMRDWLLNNCGPPKNSIKEIYKEYEDYWESDGYFIDEYKDIRFIQ